MSKTPSRKLRTRNALQEGEVYTFRFWQKEEKYKKEVKIRIRLIKKYRHFALFEHPSGIRECFDYGAVRKMMNGEILEK